VWLTGYAFAPTTITVPVGTTVTWINMDPVLDVPEGHDITIPGLAQIFLAEGETFSYTFTEPGVYNYACELHSALSMDGRVIVE
jgi:plastocyanin